MVILTPKNISDFKSSAYANTYVLKCESTLYFPGCTEPHKLYKSHIPWIYKSVLILYPCDA